MGGTELTRLAARLVPEMRRRGPYRPPDDDEVASLAVLAEALASGDAAAARASGAPLGLAATEEDGRLLLASDPGAGRAWLVLALWCGTAPGTVVEVPHPNADLDTEHVGLALAERRPGVLYLQAGAHRGAGAPADACVRADFPADVAARDDAPFARVAAQLAGRGLAQVQLHGFADRGDVDVVLSPGAAPPGGLLDAVRARLGSAGERVGEGDDPRWADLLGRRNVQGRAAAATGAAFVHLELSRSLRRDPGRREAVADALAGALDDVAGAASGGLSWR
ncbi:hypothetical protein [Actinomycetospora straminea]|uniref:Uncharacterized protein n=1 Tax=Actinomycetospora straminea TaxID=663607 RepID=A0ABP9DZK8_9PSEU|nr:hypothetical protein [Actinomycetospora straminea]MDD7931106.1 hypothetical protein [Actinomycetospora straminea]